MAHGLDWYRNELWMYPYDYNFNYLIYRTDWFAAKNLQVPTDWQGFSRMLEALNEPSNKRYAYTMPVSSGGHTNWGNTAWLWAAGVQIYDDKWNVILDSPEIKPKAVRTLEFLTKVAQYTPPGLLEVSLKDMLTNFTASISAITSYTGRLIHHIEDRSPELADKYGIMAYPGPDGGKSMVTFANDGFSIGKTANTEEALKFFRWFVKNDKLTDYQLTVPLALPATAILDLQKQALARAPAGGKTLGSHGGDAQLHEHRQDALRLYPVSGTRTVAKSGPHLESGRPPQDVPERPDAEDVSWRGSGCLRQRNPGVHGERLTIMVTLRRSASVALLASARLARAGPLERRERKLFLTFLAPGLLLVLAPFFCRCSTPSS